MVLAVDDDPALREFYAEFLAEDGHEVVVAENGESALAFLDKGPDVVLLDLQMPVMDGHAFLAELDRHPDGAHLPVVILSSGPFIAPIASKRVLAVLPKPFDFEALRQVVRRIADPPRDN
jgi:CheY-like chemotaxis protein